MAVDSPLNTLSASTVAAAIARRETTSVALLESCLDRIETRDALVCAWVHVDADLALSNARRADALLTSGKPTGPLHGVPVAVKDIFDTADMPTECGSALYRGRQPARDARAVSLLRAAGAIVLGKTVTAELALSAPGASANPLDLRRTPGGSSSGSAAAVADFMAPLAVGSQTTGSVVRPASYCGIVGFKPSFDLIPTAGMHMLARALDHVGVFARNVTDIRLIMESMLAARWDADRRGGARIGVVRAPVWDEASADARAQFDAWTHAHGLHTTIELGEIFDDAVACQRLILDFNLAATLGGACENTPELLHEITRSRIDGGRHISANALQRAVAKAERQRARLTEIFRDYDALLTLAAPGEAPLGLSSTGNAVFSAIWTLMGVPTISLPVLEGENGLPIGIQLIGAMGEDATLLTVADEILAMASTTVAIPKQRRTQQ